MTTNRLVNQLIRHEGMELKMYKCPAGYNTIGAGHNLDENPITEQAARKILEDDIFIAYTDLVRAVPWMDKVDEVRLEAFVNMVFNLGITRFKKFEKMIEAAHNGQWDEAARQALDSKWADQVGFRALELAEQIKTGQYGN